MKRSKSLGIGLVEVLVGLVIGMVLLLMVFQSYLVAEGQKRTITASNDAQENASYGLFLLASELAGAGNVVAVTLPNATTPALSGCAMLRPIPVTITAGATSADPDTVTVFYGGSGALSTPTPLLNSAAVGGASPGVYQVAGPVGFSPNDLIVAVEESNCTLSKVNADGVSVASGTGIATLSHKLTATAGNNSSATYGASTASIINLGQGSRAARTAYAVDTTNSTLTSQSLLPTEQAVTPAVSNIVNIKALYGLDTDNDGSVDTWQAATGNWSASNLAAQPLGADLMYPWQQVRAIRIAIVSRSDKYEVDAVTAGPLTMFCAPPPCAISMPLTTDQTHYRYKVMETIVPLRNAIWNAP